MSNPTEMIMKTAILAASLIATVLASAVSVQAAERKMPFDGQKIFQEIERLGSSHG